MCYNSHDLVCASLRGNSSQVSSSYPLPRPDLSATIYGSGCLFRGEEKELGSSEDPLVELYEKLQGIWPLPGLPVVPGYFSVDSNLTFACVYMDRAVPLSNPLLLANIKMTQMLGCSSQYHQNYENYGDPVHFVL